MPMISRRTGKSSRIWKCRDKRAVICHILGSNQSCLVSEFKFVIQELLIANITLNEKWKSFMFLYVLSLWKLSSLTMSALLSSNLDPNYTCARRSRFLRYTLSTPKYCKSSSNMKPKSALVLNPNALFWVFLLRRSPILSRSDWSQHFPCCVN